MLVRLNLATDKISTPGEGKNELHKELVAGPADASAVWQGLRHGASGVVQLLPCVPAAVMAVCSDGRAEPCPQLVSIARHDQQVDPRSTHTS